MKYTNVMLTLACMMLAIIAWGLFQMRPLLQSTQAGNELLVSAHQALIQSNARLENELAALRKEIQNLKDNYLKR